MSEHDSPTSCMKVDQEATLSQLNDAIHERLFKATAVLNALICEENVETLSRHILMNALWAADGLVSEAQALQSALWDKAMDQENVIRDQVMDEVEAAKREAQS